MIMKFLKISLLIAVFFGLFSCESIVDEINEDDPNTFSSVRGETLFSGILLADITAQSGYLNWTSSVWSGYFEGIGRFDAEQNYQFSNVNSNTPWSNIYQGVVRQAREIRSGIPISNQEFFYGASKVIEAHAVGTAANLFGDVPYTEASNDEIPTPSYDGQLEVYASLQNLLDEAIADLQSSGATGGIDEDLFYNGDANNWIKAAYTLKARLYMETGNYANAIAAAQNGISSINETMRYNPPAEVGTGDTNILNQFFTGSFSTDLGIENSFIHEFLTAGNRNNAKTDETYRAAYYYDGVEINLNGIAGVEEPVNQISYQENLLIWAEALIRGGAGNFDAAVAKLNEHRANLRNGVYFTISTGIYDDYIAADFENGGIENVDGSLSREDALLREIIEERYVTFFADVIGFSDIRRFEKDAAALQVPVPFNTGAQRPQRFLYPFDEVNTNSNVPNITDIFIKTPVNQ